MLPLFSIMTLWVNHRVIILLKRACLHNRIGLLNFISLITKFYPHVSIRFIITSSLTLYCLNSFFHRFRDIDKDKFFRLPTHSRDAHRKFF